MACLEMYNQKNNKSSSSSSSSSGAPHHPPLMSPRISFSNDFVESSSLSSSSLSNSHHHHHHRHQIRAAAPAYRDAPVSSDFEFSVSNYSMMSADELFFKGRLLPLKEEGNQKTTTTTTTLRDELLNQEEDGGGGNEEDGGFSLRPPKNPTRWRGFLGLRKSHIGSKKTDKAVTRNTNNNGDDHDNNNVQCSKNSQDFVD